MQLNLRRLFKWLGYIALGCYLLLAVAVLGIRHWVLPNINQWREPLQQQLSDILPVQLELGEVHAQWRGRHPEINLRNAVMRDDDGRLLLQLPSLNIEIAWSALLSDEFRFFKLSADGVELAVKRDANNRISLVGYEIGSVRQGQDREQDASLAYWLSRQGDVKLTNARITWVDERRAAPALELKDVALSLSQENGEHDFSIAARPPKTMGDAFSLQARLRLNVQPGRGFSVSDISGLFYANVENMRLAGWQPWLEINSALEKGRISWRAWQQLENGEPRHHVSQITVQHGVWNPEAGVGVTADEAQVYLAGDWQALRTVHGGVMPMSESTVSDGSLPGAAGAARNGDMPTLRFATQVRGLSVTSEVFEHALNFDELSLNAAVGRDARTGLRALVDRAHIRNRDMDLIVEGEWQELGGGVAGLADLSGRFNRAELSAIVRYLPTIVHGEARKWMEHGLLAGRLSDAPVVFRGDLAHFPFGDHPERGDFKLGGKVQGVVIDYAPATVIGPPGWPKLEALNGHAQLHRVELTIRADTMQMRPGDDLIELRDVDARIPDIEDDSVLHVDGVGEAQAPAFIALIRESPLGAWLNDMLGNTKGEGRWQVPISLTIPLTDTGATKVAGEVVFDKAQLLLDPALPKLADLSGRLAFSETKLSVQELTGRALGGSVKISGGIGEGQKGMVFEGGLTATALDNYLQGRLGGVAQGKAPYRLAVQRDANGAIGVSLQSSLEGLSLNLPPPFSKAPEQRWPLQASWAPASSSGRDTVLSAKLAELLDVRLVRRSGGPSQSFFHAGAVSVRGNAEQPPEGLAVDLRAKSVDIDAWRDTKTKFENTGPNAAGGTALFPPLRDLRLQADKAKLFGVDLDQLTYTARQPEGRRWRVDVSSTQTAGTLFWRESSGRIEGDIEANFQRLAIGEESPKSKDGEEEDEPTYTLDDELEFPAVRLKVDKLRLYGRDVGSLSVVGLNDAREHRWSLEELELASPHATFRGSGVWQLKGPRRGLRLEAKGMFDDLGSYLEQAGFRNLVEGGHGEVTGVVEWRNIPWRFERTGLHGDLKMDLAKGRFVNVGSHSARILELLSLQSVKRLASLNWNPAGLLKQGFPFDTLQGHITMKEGVLHSENYRVTGPVATIVIAGDVDLPQEMLDLYAVVVPNLDVSGAAIAAGIAVNPIVGVGAFLTQWLLKSPMSKAMTVEYRVRGNFDEPDIEAIDTEKKGN